MNRARLPLTVWLGLILLVPVLLHFAPDAQSVGQDEVTRIPVEKVEKKKEQLQLYMHAKISYSEQVFEGLVTKDFKKIRSGAESLQVTSLSTPRVDAKESRDDEVFEHFKMEFVRLASRLGQMAEEENLEGAAYVNEQLNATCIACHQYLRDEPAVGKPKRKTKPR